MVVEDGNGKGQRTFKGLRMNKTVCKYFLNMFIFSVSFFYSLKFPPFGQKASFKVDDYSRF